MKSERNERFRRKKSDNTLQPSEPIAGPETVAQRRARIKAQRAATARQLRIRHKFKQNTAPPAHFQYRIVKKHRVAREQGKKIKELWSTKILNPKVGPRCQKWKQSCNHKVPAEGQTISIEGYTVPVKATSVKVLSWEMFQSQPIGLFNLTSHEQVLQWDGYSAENFRLGHVYEFVPVPYGNKPVV